MQQTYQDQRLAVVRMPGEEEYSTGRELQAPTVLKLDLAIIMSVWRISPASKIIRKRIKLRRMHRPKTGEIFPTERPHPSHPNPNLEPPSLSPPSTQHSSLSSVEIPIVDAVKAEPAKPVY